MPAEMRGNNPLFDIDRSRPFPIFPIRFTDGPPENKVNAMITWIENVDSAFDNLVSAYYSYSVGKYNDAIIPANVAVEFSLNKFTSKVLSAYVSRKRVTEFLENDATYGQQLNILLPYIVAMQGKPLKPLSDKIRGKLNTLRSMRNDVAHRGQGEDSIEKRAIAECLVAALFGYIYVQMLDIVISKSKT